MKNPFIKNDNRGIWIAAAVLGTVTAATLSYLFLTDRGSNVRKKIADVAGEATEHATNFIKAKLPSKDQVKAEAHELEGIIAN